MYPVCYTLKSNVGVGDDTHPKTPQKGQVIGHQKLFLFPPYPDCNPNSSFWLTSKLSISPHFPASAPGAPHHCAPGVSSEQPLLGCALAPAFPAPHCPLGLVPWPVSTSPPASKPSSTSYHQQARGQGPLWLACRASRLERVLSTSTLLLPPSHQSCSHKGLSSLMCIPLHASTSRPLCILFLLLRMHESHFQPHDNLRRQPL